MGIFCKPQGLGMRVGARYRKFVVTLALALTLAQRLKHGHTASQLQRTEHFHENLHHPIFAG